ncbi:MAG: MmgE/PrpD family protein, partial [Planctomycetes bacterium]|nr:MmgE/PrpD family protein [Planctomycetota bacterium]
VRDTASRVLLDICGNAVSTRDTAYVQSLPSSWDGEGPCTALGHARRLDAAGAALVNGTAAHGEDFDDTFEGSPVHAGAPVVPAVLATCERHALPGPRALLGIVTGMELMCRMTLVAPTAIHRAGFHPTAVIGAMGATLGVATALGLPPRDTASALGIAGSMAGGIIEYLAEGTSTKRLHPGWAAQSGIRAALMARAGFSGPRTVFEGTHGFFKGFADASIPADLGHLTRDLGGEWLVERIAFKPYACGTMAQPYIDCAVRLVEQGLDPERVARIDCETGEGIVHRLWEPLAEKHAPSTPYSAKFSVPYCVAAGLVRRKAGLAEFTEESIRDPGILALAAKVHYVVDPDDEYPRNYTGHVRVTLDDGSVVEARQPHMRGGARERLTMDELAAKARANLLFGGWDEARAEALQAVLAGLFEQDAAVDLSAFAG